VNTVLRASLETGLRHVDRALRLAPDDAAALELRGLLRYAWVWLLEESATPRAVELLAGAESDLRHAIRSDPNRVRAWTTLSAILHEAGSGSPHSAPQTRLRRTHVRLPGSTRPMMRRADESRARQLNGEPDSARQVLASASRTAPGDPELLQLEAGARVILGENDRAAELLERYSAKSPAKPEFFRQSRRFATLREHPLWSMTPRPAFSSR
jgi:hypothetical protein